MDRESELLLRQVSQAGCETRADASRPGSEAYTSLFFFLSVKHICSPETSLYPQMTINTFYLES